MEIELSNEKEFLIFKISGRLDTTTSDQLEREINDHIDQKINNVILDFKNLNYISSAGLRVVLMLAKTMNEKKGKFFLTALNQEVYQVFEISGFLNILTVKATIQEAIGE